MWKVRGAILVVILGALAIAYAGVSMLVQRETGTRARATVSECHGFNGQYTHVTCTGSWVIGGSLLGKGHVVVGDISGAENGDVGKTLDVTVRGNTAYTRGLGLPIGLIVGGGLGAVIAAGVMVVFWKGDS